MNHHTPHRNQRDTAFQTTNLNDQTIQEQLFCGLRFVICSFLFIGLFPETVSAQELTYRHQHHLFNINIDEQIGWKSLKEVWLHNDKEIRPHAQWRIDGDETPALPEGIVRRKLPEWNREAIAVSIDQHIGNQINREPGSVTIGRDDDGNVTFDGIGFPGRELNLDQAVTLTIYAIENEMNDIVLPVEEIQPEITITDDELRKNGIQELLTVGESNYSGSPANRQHNIANGVSKFNGQLIPKDSTFSFNAILGPVNAQTGYKKELVIQGSRTIPEYGGGLCQVSTTAYRGVWEYGLPIEARRNHSYAVVYYAPQGTDSTIYPPWTDLKFTNDTPGDLLIQTYTEGQKAYFLYYGTKDNRVAEIMGPYNWNEKPAPPKRTEFVSDLPPGEVRQVGSAVPGLSVAWFRTIQKDGVEQEPEAFYSHYEARPDFFQVGIGGSSSATASVAPSGATARGEQPVKTPMSNKTTVRRAPSSRRGAVSTRRNRRNVRANLLRY